MYPPTIVAADALSDTSGIHHVTGIVRDAQITVDWYVTVLGLQLVLQTVNFTDEFTRHLWFGDDTGSPGTVLTFFPYPDADDGRVGPPQISAAGLAIPPDAVGYWTDRLAANGVDATEATRFGETVLRIRDPDGTPIDLVATPTPVDPRHDGPVDPRYAIRSIHGVTLHSTNSFVTASVLDTLGCTLEGQDGDRVRYRASGHRATVFDLIDRDGPFGRAGTGTFHHVAVRVPNTDHLFGWHRLFRERDYSVSRVMDRHFFHSLYVREPGGILFELATEQPGLSGDAREAGGQSLVLPPWLEVNRDVITGQLPPLDVDHS